MADKLISFSEMVKKFDDCCGECGCCIHHLPDHSERNTHCLILNSLKAVDAVTVVRCRECKNGAPLPEEAMAEFSPGVMRCLAGRGDCDRYCTTWEDGFCDEGVKLDAKDMDVPTKDGGAGNG